jgi:hypothetical protein
MQLSGLGNKQGKAGSHVAVVDRKKSITLRAGSHMGEI